MDPILIVGSGLAGYNVARELRKLDKEIPLALITADGGEFYSKPMLSNALTTGKSAAALAMNSAEQMAGQVNAQIRTHCQVTALEPAQHRVKIADETIPYSRLVLALGAEQVRLPLAGNAAADIITVNDLDDYANFRGRIADKKRVVIIGGGLIGCEFANDLAQSGYQVDMIDIADQALPRLLPPAGGALMQVRLSALGVTWHLGASVQSVEKSGDGARLTLTTGTVIESDVVLSAVGLRPRVELARAAGIEVNRGIIINRMLETSAPDVYALGDCVEIDGLILPYVMPIMHSARALAATLAGKPTPVNYPGMPVLVKTPCCPTVVSPPRDSSAGQWQVEADSEGVKALFLDASGKLLGFALNGTATAERAKLTPQLPPVLEPVKA